MGSTNDGNKLKDYVYRRFNQMFDEILSSIEPAVRNDYSYQITRKRVLRSGNNAMRDIQGYIGQVEVVGQVEPNWEIFEVEDKGGQNGD